MRSISELPVNLDVNYVRRHKHQLAYFFENFKNISTQGLARPLLAYKIAEHQFDELGTLWVREADLDRKSLRLLQTIEDSYMSTSFFLKSGRLIGTRGYVYYVSALQDDDQMRSVLRLINHASTSAGLLGELFPGHKERWEVGIYSLLDDIRYKLLILDEHIDLTSAGTDLLDQAISLFYDYLQGTIPAEAEVKQFTQKLQIALLEALKAPAPQELRSYKEADNPLQNLIFRDTLIERLQGAPVDALIGIRLGGTELPHLMKKYIPYARIIKVRASNYSADKHNDLNLSDRINTGESALVLDDNALTGRTLQNVVLALKDCGVRNIYFGCVTYSGMKRYPQMIMSGHGVINPEVLMCSCVVGESPYTRITSSRSYKNNNGVFDKVKVKLQRRMTDDNLGYKL